MNKIDTCQFVIMQSRLVCRTTVSTFSKCKSCKFVCSERKPTKDELDEVYNNYDYNTEESSLTSASMKKYKDICNHIMSLGKISSVLDVGCGRRQYL